MSTGAVHNNDAPAAVHATAYCMNKNRCCTTCVPILLYREKVALIFFTWWNYVRNCAVQHSALLTFSFKKLYTKFGSPFIFLTQCFTSSLFNYNSSRHAVIISVHQIIMSHNQRVNRAYTPSSMNLGMV